jgi:hypothetical protein
MLCKIYAMWLDNSTKHDVRADLHVIFRGALRETSLGNVSGEWPPSGRGMEYRGVFVCCAI